LELRALSRQGYPGHITEEGGTRRPRRHPGGTQRHPEAPRRHPGGSEAENLENDDFCIIYTAYLTNGRKSAW